MLVLLVTHYDSPSALYWLCLPAALFHIGVLTGFIGIARYAGGQGYKDSSVTPRRRDRNDGARRFVHAQRIGVRVVGAGGFDRAVPR